MIMSLPCFTPAHGNKIRVTNKKVSGKQPDIAGSVFFVFGKLVSGFVPKFLRAKGKKKKRSTSGISPKERVHQCSGF